MVALGVGVDEAHLMRDSVGVFVGIEAFGEEVEEEVNVA